MTEPAIYPKEPHEAATMLESAAIALSRFAHLNRAMLMLQEASADIAQFEDLRAAMERLQQTTLEADFCAAMYSAAIDVQREVVGLNEFSELADAMRQAREDADWLDMFRAMLDRFDDLSDAMRWMRSGAENAAAAAEAIAAAQTPADE